MKLSITEKFLWDVYNFLYKGDSTPTQGLYGTIFDPYGMSRLLRGGGKFDAMHTKLYEKYRKKYGKERFSKFIYYLKKKGYIEAKSWETKKAFILTNKGFGKIIMHQFISEKLPLREDGKWQMVIFDIPEKLRKLRNQFRGILKSLGYKQLQKSVWVSPYDVAEKTKNFISVLNLEDDVKLFLVESIQEIESKLSK